MAGNNVRGGRLSISLLLGMLLIPVSAVVAVALVNPGESETTSSEEVTTTTVTDTAATERKVVVEPVSASQDDLTSACGEDGLYLVGLEDNETISDVQQAALDALRQLCSEVGTPLPGPAAPPPIVRTEVREVSSETTEDSYEDHDEHDEDDYEDDDHEDESRSTEADYKAAHAAAVSAIESARANGGDGEDIAEAMEKLAEAEKKAQEQDWDEATEKANSARHEALGSTDENDD